MNNGIDLDDLPGAQARARAGRRALVKPKPVLQGRIHRPEIRRIPNLPEAWGEPSRIASFFRSCAEYLVVGLKFTLLLTLGAATVVGIIFGGYLLLEAVVTWAFDAAVGLLDWLLSGIQFLAKSAIEFIIGLIAGILTFIFDAIVSIIGFILEILLGFLIIVAIACLVSLLSPILIPLALLYFVYISIF